MGKPLIAVNHLKKSYGNNVVLRDVSVEIERGDVIAVIGPSGCGKSTFIRCLNLLEEPDSGQIVVDGVQLNNHGSQIDGVRRKMGMVYQDFNLFSHLTVLENVILAPTHVLKIPRAQAISEAFALLQLVGMAPRADFMPNQLSGGQKQRAAIARCLAMRPEIILFDEPTSALDPTMIDEVLAVIRKLVKTGMTSVIVTHEMAFARHVSNRVFFMEEGGIYEQGTPEEVFDNPQREKTRIFINKLKVFERSGAIHLLDPFELVQELTDYCNKYELSRRETNNITLVLEEILVFLTHHASVDDRVRIFVSYNESTGEKKMEIGYSFPSGNLLEHPDFDPLSRRLVEGFSTGISVGTKEGLEHLFLEGF